MDVNIKWAQYRNFSGCKIAGTIAVPKPDPKDNHMERAFYLTALLEAPMYGAVQSYDGAGMSGGPLHNIAVFPRNLKEQGSLFKLLRHLELRVRGCKPLAALWVLYRSVGWYIAGDGVLRKFSTGAPISGRDIRNEFAPPNGKVPRSGPERSRANMWARAHHELFADPRTFDAQKEFAIDYLLNSQKTYELKWYGSDARARQLTVSAIGPASDLAMCVYHAFSVNGPAPARSVLRDVAVLYTTGEEFAKRLIWGLGRRKYGNWEKRYARTRYHARKSGLWPEHLFARDSVMPDRLPARFKL